LQLSWSLAGVATTKASRTPRAARVASSAPAAFPAQVGECLWGGTDALAGVAAFVAEREDYDFGTVITNTNYLTFGHYTQVVWEETTDIGCAVGNCGTYPSCLGHRVHPAASRRQLIVMVQPSKHGYGDNPDSRGGP
jgi:hypothetical protein